MRDAIEMWREPRMVVLTGVCAAVFAAAMVPFKVLVVFPGLAEVRPAAVLPVVFSFLFGPAGAFGAAFGNVVGDMLGGMLGLGSFFGFIANFAYGYLPYKLWQAWGGDREVGETLAAWRARLPAWVLRPSRVALLLAAIFIAGAGVLYGLAAAGRVELAGLINYRWGDRSMAAGLAATTAVLALGVTAILGSLIFLRYSPIRYLLVVLVACLACAGLLGWGIELLGYVPFRIFAPWILIENFILGLTLGPPLLLLLHPRVAKRYMLFEDIMGKRRRRPSAGWGAALTTAAVAALFGAGVAVSPALLGGWLGVESSQDLVKGLLLAPVAALLFFGLGFL